MPAGCNWYLVNSWNQAASPNQIAKPNPCTAGNRRVLEALTARHFSDEAPILLSLIFEQIQLRTIVPAPHIILEFRLKTGEIGNTDDYQGVELVYS